MALLDGCRIIVTGAAGGIGKAIVGGFLSEGAQVLAVDKQPIELLLDGGCEGQPVSGLSIDITEDSAPAKIIAEAVARLGGLDVLVNNAGISSFIPLVETSDQDWAEVINLNLTAVFRLCRDAVPLLKSSEAGRIINMGSIMSGFGGAGLAAYAASKHGIAGLTKCLATELGEFGITANYIQPGAILTDITRRSIEADPDFEMFWKNKSALGRWGQPEDIAPVAVFLASKHAGFISGTGVVADGAAMQAP